MQVSKETLGILDRDLHRLQACIDQLVGQDVFVQAGGLVGFGVDPIQARGKVLDMANQLLGGVMSSLGVGSAQSDADAAAWILHQLRP